MSSFSVVLDACVLIPAAIRDTLLRAAAEGLYRLHWSEDILEEVERNLSRHGLTTKARATSLVAVMRDFFPEANTVGYQHLIPAMTNDEKDRHVVAVAVVSGAQVIVTENLRDFPASSLEPFGIEAQSSDQFLEHLLDLDPAKMISIIQQQANDLEKPPKTIDELVAALSEYAPTFTARVHEELVDTGLW